MTSYTAFSAEGIFSMQYAYLLNYVYSVVKSFGPLKHDVQMRNKKQHTCVEHYCSFVVLSNQCECITTEYAHC